MRDLRDPELCGLAYLKARSLGAPIEDAVSVPVRAYENGKYISCDPKDHHSRTPQDMGNLDDGGAS